MKLNDPAQITARMQSVDHVLEAAGMPSYTQMWATNAQLRAELDQLKDRLGMAHLALSKARGDLVQAELIVGTAASVAQIKRELARMKGARAVHERDQHERFEQRWGASGESGG